MSNIIDYEIYQVKDNDDGHYMRYNSLANQAKYGYNVDISKYEQVYSGQKEESSSPFETLESIYTEFNISPPEDYRSYSLSVSDIVVLNENGKKKAYYCDSIGFTELPDFFTIKKEPIQSMIENAEKRKTESNKTRPVPQMEK